MIDESADLHRMEEGTRFDKAIRKLPSKLLAIAFGLRALDVNGKKVETDYRHGRFVNDAQATAAADFGRLSQTERIKLLQVSFPRMAADVERTSTALRKGPYQSGWKVKAFRAPRHPDLTLNAQQSWMLGMLGLAETYREEMLDPIWLAQWAPYLKRGWMSWQADIATLLATVMDTGGPTGDAVFEILRQSLTNEHEIGSMGTHVVRGLLMSSREQGWELIEKTLLAAQRQEGLRQSILEAIDLAHPTAYRRMLRIVREHDLARFSAVARAVNVWFGFAWDSVSVKVINGAIETVLTMLDDEDARRKALSGSDPESAFLALWAAAFEDAPASIPLAERLLQHKSAEMRFVALTHLGHLDLAEAQAVRWTASDDADLRVALRAIGAITTPAVGEDGHAEDAGAPQDDSFERLERLFQRLPEKPTELKPLVWPWTGLKASRETVAPSLLAAIGRRSPTRLLPYLPALNPWQRRSVVELFANQKKWDAATRDTLIGLAGDASADVRVAAFEAIKKLKPTDAEVQRLLATLTRKAADLRAGVIGLLMDLSDARTLACADVLLGSKDAQQRLAGLELLRQLVEQQRTVAECRQRATTFRDQRGKLTKDEQRQLDAILLVKPAAQTLTLDNALGLMDPTQRTPVVAPRNLKTRLITPAAIACLRELDELVHQHRETPIVTNPQSNETQLLGTITWGFPHPDISKKSESEAKRLPLREVWDEWFEKRSKKTRDADGLELLRADRWFEYALEYDWKYEQWQQWTQRKPHRKAMLAPLDAEKPIKLRSSKVVEMLLKWLLFLHRPASHNDYLLDAAETLASAVPKEELQALNAKPTDESQSREDVPWYGPDWRQAGLFGDYLWRLNGVDVTLTPEQVRRRWRIESWLDRPTPDASRCRPNGDVLMQAYDGDFANLNDVADHLLGPRGLPGYGQHSFALLEQLTRRRLTNEHQRFLETHSEVRELVDRARRVVLETELARGEAPTPATDAAHALGSLAGVETLVRLIQALGKEGFKPAIGWRHETKLQRPQTLTHLVSITYPAASDTPDEFAKRMRVEVEQKSFPETRLIELAFLGPQWTKFVEAYFRWDGLAEGLYWFLAHMRFLWGSDIGDQAAESAGVDADTAKSEVADSDTAAASVTEEDDSEVQEPAPKPEKLSAWERLIRERTALSNQERADGAIDVMWFQRVFAALGPKRWQQLAQAAKFASNAAQAKKAQFIADVLLGQAKLADLIAGIEKKYLKDNVRLLGLFPLPAGTKRDAELARRFKILQDYSRYAKQLSGLTKPQALRALEIGLKNLASTAGYADALRLDWALGVSQWADLRRGPVSATKDDVTVTLLIDAEVKPSILVTRGDKELKSAPPAVKKHAPIAALFERARELKRHASRQKQALEAAMCRGDQFSASELSQLCQHALVAPLLERLVLVGDGVLGYPDKNGKALRNHSGKLEPIKKNEQFRIAHPHDLLASGDWAAWQRDCFQAERVQPFKQVFRELYVVTKQEKSDGDRSRRYAGQQVNPSQALALWGHRGWNTGDGVFKVFHHEGLVASVEFQHGMFTPLEVEGLTLDAITFTKRNEYDPFKLTAVPPHLFSEVMRDCDLVVSVAHRGGVDPEATASTVEMRASLVRETSQLLGLKNVRLKAQHVLINGKLAEYSIHLGSGNVHRLPGGALCVVPVHAQHRGRLFLPFADDDPRTAEVISKVLLLARDYEIQDPGILEQLRR